MRFARRITVMMGALLGVLAPSALADSVDSSNWAGYAVHRSGVRFSKVVGAWKQPKARCTNGQSTYSAVWVGIGGFSETSQALEQVGTEVDCRASGRAVSSAWYEIVPAPSEPIRMTVNPGDAMYASVVVSGRQVTMVLQDATRHRSFRKTVRVSVVDASSAEWIVEAPSECINAQVCRTLPLANFGSETFGLAATQSTNGHSGRINDSAWNTTKIRLASNGRRFVVDGGSATAAVATPSALTGDGSSFKVTYSTATALRASPFAGAAQVGFPGGYIVH